MDEKEKTVKAGVAKPEADGGAEKRPPSPKRRASIRTLSDEDRGRELKRRADERRARIEDLQELLDRHKRALAEEEHEAVRAARQAAREAQHKADAAERRIAALAEEVEAATKERAAVEARLPALRAAAEEARRKLTQEYEACESRCDAETA